MEYITSGDRIAVENFEIGSLYKVTFLSETEVYFMCCGIGKDFVMLMSNEPRLFSLTMLSAAEVDAIDEYTPLPPPTPPTNLLQYQTGEPPFTFTTTDTELFSWYIKGPAGEKTANLLFDKIANCAISSTGVLENSSSNDMYLARIESGKTYSINTPAYVGYFITEPVKGDTSYDNTRTLINAAFTAPITGYIAIRASHSTNDLMFNEGQTALPYEPYGMYKIPISCNTTISNIYIEEALGKNDILHSTETDYTIVTEIGENILRIQGETQPSRMQIVYKWEFEG